MSESEKSQQSLNPAGPPFWEAEKGGPITNEMESRKRLSTSNPTSRNQLRPVASRIVRGQEIAPPLVVQSPEEKTVRSILKNVGATRARVESNQYELWLIPGGKTYTCASKASKHSWRDDLLNLRRLLKSLGYYKQAAKAVVSKEDAVAALMVVKSAKNAAKKAAKAAAKAAKAAKQNDKSAPGQVLEHPASPPLVSPPPVVAAPEPEPTESVEQIAEDAVSPRKPKSEELEKPAEPDEQQDDGHKVWTDEQLQLLHCGIESDLEYTEIAAELQKLRPNANAIAIARKARQMGWERPRKNKQQLLQRQFKVDRPVGYNLGRGWTYEEDLLLIKLFQENKATKEIVQAINEAFYSNRTTGSVYNRIYALRGQGLILNDRRRSPARKKTGMLADSPAPAPVPAREGESELASRRPPQPQYVLILIFPDGRRVKTPVSQGFAESMSLKILAGDMM